MKKRCKQMLSMLLALLLICGMSAGGTVSAAEQQEQQPLPVAQEEAVVPGGEAEEPVQAAVGATDLFEVAVGQALWLLLKPVLEPIVGVLVSNIVSPILQKIFGAIIEAIIGAIFQQLSEQIVEAIQKWMKASFPAATISRSPRCLPDWKSCKRSTPFQEFESLTLRQKPMEVKHFCRLSFGSSRNFVGWSDVGKSGVIAREA